MTAAFAEDIILTEEEAEAILTEDPDAVSRETPADPEAPYGRFKNGKPRRSAPAERKPRAVKAPSRRTSRPRASGPGYEEKSALALEFVPAVLTVVAGARKSEPLLADAITVREYTPALARIGGRLAEQDARFAALLDRLSSGGKYGEAVTVGLAMVLQIAVNHDRMKPVEALGVVSRETLLERAAA